MTKLKKKQLKYFHQRVDYWCNYLGLSDWRVWSEEQEVDDAYGQCVADLKGRTAVIACNPLWDYDPDNTDIDKVALHEALELLLWHLHELASERFTTEPEWEAARHGVIRRLENVLG